MRFRSSVARLLLSLGVLACSCCRVWAQGAPPETPGQLVRLEDGFSVDLAGGFELGRQQEGYYLLGSRTIPGLILIRALPGLTATELNRSLRSGYSDPTVQLTPVSRASEVPMKDGFGRLAEVEGVLMEEQVRGLLAGYLRDSGGGLLLFAVTTPRQWPELNPVAGKIAESVRLFVPDPQELIRLWTERLAGFQLIRATDKAEGAPRADPEETRTYHLCSGGTFLYGQGGEEGAPKDNAAGQPEHIAGNWEVVPAGLRVDLVLTFEDGRNDSYHLSRMDQETYLDDQRYFVLPNERCR